MAISNMMKQYNNVKAQYPDCVLFFRLGDFYEMFYDDAIRVSEMLDLTLTGKNCGLDEKAPMCGIPYHASENYISKLVSMGEKVAICEQLEEASASVKLVERDVVRIVSAGTVTEDCQIDEKTNNFIMSVYYGKEKIGLAWADITTGEFYVKSCQGEDVLTTLSDNLVRINPSEIICNEKMFNFSLNLPVVKHKVVVKFNPFSETAYNPTTAEKTLKEQFNVSKLDAYGISEKLEEISCSGALIEYLKQTQKHSLININKVKEENLESQMQLDASAIKNLELVKAMKDGKRYGSLLWVIDKTKTSMGARNLHSWVLNPLRDIDKINYRLDGVEELFKATLIRNGIMEELANIKDVERISGKISNGNLTPRDMRALCDSLSVLPNVKMQLFGTKSQILQDVNNAIVDFSELVKIINSALVLNPPMLLKEGGYVADGFDKEIDRLRNIRANGKDIIDDIERRERERTGIKNLRISYNKVFGYYIEITNSFKNLVPYDYIRKQTLTNAERYITEELKKVEEDILSSDETIKRKELEIFNKLKELLTQNIKNLQKTSRALACLDTLISLAQVARQNGYVRPTILESDKAMNIVGGRHLVVEEVSNEQFIPNDLYLDSEENKVMIITGPNMAGKSTYMRQNALIVILAQIGSFVPAKVAEIPVIDRVFTRVGASDNLILDQSTFMVEMTEVASILLHATNKSLLILDEVGRGTSTYDGLSIAWAVVEHLAENIKAKTLFATHYHELSELEGKLYGVKNYKVTVKEINGTIAFLRKISRGSANKSFGIEVASLAGVPESVTKKAKGILKALEKNDLVINFKEEQVIEEETVDNELIDYLNSLDINSLSPIKALNVLSEIKEKYCK